MTSKEYFLTIYKELGTFNFKAVEKLCIDIIKELYCSDENFEILYAEKILQQLRNKRLFLLMQKLGDALIQTGRLSYKVRRQYAQSLIDQNNLTAALVVLKELITDTTNAPAENEKAKVENAEARGLAGRVYKQLYVNANCPHSSTSIDYIKDAIKFYLDVYISEPESKTWHGINAVALIKRAAADNIDIPGTPDANELANSILQTIILKNADRTADAWDFATASEACVALNNPEEALEWMSGYARMPDCDAFELASTLRQFTEVWRLDINTEMGMLLLPILKAELLSRDGGSLSFDAGELKQMKEAGNEILNKYDSLKKEQSPESKFKPEKVFGNDSFQTFKLYKKGLDRCLAVARIGKDSSEGVGTGFLLKGGLLKESLGEELVLITNAHVVSDDAAEKALRVKEAIITFEALDPAEEFRGFEIIWSSPYKDLDATIIRFSEQDQERLKTLAADLKVYPVSPYLPVIDPGAVQKIYVIGHPYGGVLRISYENNILIGCKDPKMHYRTATDNGSSGSPVFNEQWDLIGLHHAGSEEMEDLDNSGKVHEANEGIWIQAIKKSYAENNVK